MNQKNKEVNIEEQLKKIKSKIHLECINLDNTINEFCGDIDLCFYKIAKRNTYFSDKNIQHFASKHPDEIKNIQLSFPTITDSITIITTAQEYFNEAQLQKYRKEIVLVFALNYCLQKLQIKEIPLKKYRSMKKELDYRNVTKFDYVYNIVQKVLQGDSYL